MTLHFLGFWVEDQSGLGTQLTGEEFIDRRVGASSERGTNLQLNLVGERISVSS